MVQDRSNPFRGFLDMFTEMERMRRLGRSGGVGGSEEHPRTDATAWVPTADILADGTGLVIRVEVPGVKPDDITITFAGGVLTISGVRRGDLSDDTVYYVRERYHGPFERSMILPDGIDESMITASFEDGIAEIVVVGAAGSAEPSRIPIEDRSRAQVTRRGARPGR